MKARSFDIGKVIEEINQNSIDATLQESIKYLDLENIDDIYNSH